MLKTIEDLSKLVIANYRPVAEATVQSLMDSIREVGVREPIRIFECEDTRETYVLAGHHRVEAVKRLKAMNPAIAYSIPAFVTKGKKADLAAVDAQLTAVVGNVFTPSAHVLDRALGYKQLRQAGLSAASIARIAGVSENLVHKTLAVAELPEDAKDWIRTNPRVNDSAVYAAAAKFRRDGGGDIKTLMTTPTRTSQKPAATKSSKVINVDLSEFEQRLRVKAKLQDSVIQKVLAVL